MRRFPELKKIKNKKIKKREKEPSSSFFPPSLCPFLPPRQPPRRTPLLHHPLPHRLILSPLDKPTDSSISPSAQISCSDTQSLPPDSIQLFLNCTDEILSPLPGNSLPSLGLTSGDLLFFTLSPNPQTLSLTNSRPSLTVVPGRSFSLLARWCYSPPPHGGPSPSPPLLMASSAPPIPSSPPLMASSSSFSILAFPQSLQHLPPNCRPLTTVPAIVELFWLHDTEGLETLLPKNG